MARTRHAAVVETTYGVCYAGMRQYIFGTPRTKLPMHFVDSNYLSVDHESFFLIDDKQDCRHRVLLLIHVDVPPP
jgi:hypothetical protein